MIVLDTSALMAILLGEPDADAIVACLEFEEEIIISAGTLAETLIVSARRGVGKEMEDLLEALVVSVEPVCAATSRQVAQAYTIWGKAMHPAGLNFGDCFAYALARKLDAALVFVGDDFSKTDVRSALSR